MKNLLFILLLVSFCSNAQVVDICTGNIPQHMPPGSYIKDVDNQFNKFNGTWIWADGNKTVTFKLQKVIRFLDAEYNNYADFMIGDYSYSNNGNIIVNTIDQITNVNPAFHPMFACCLENSNKINFSFEDVIIGKTGCSAIFEFLSGSTTQMKLTLKNREGSIGFMVAEGEPLIAQPINHDFTIPNEIILTRQP